MINLQRLTQPISGQTEALRPSDDLENALFSSNDTTEDQKLALNAFKGDIFLRKKTLICLILVTFPNRQLWGDSMLF